MDNVINLSQKIEEKENADKNNIIVNRLNELLNKAIINGLPEYEQEEVASLHSEYKAICDDAITESQFKLAEFAIIEMCEMLVRYKILSDEDIEVIKDKYHVM